MRPRSRNNRCVSDVTPIHSRRATQKQAATSGTARQSIVLHSGMLAQGQPRQPFFDRRELQTIMNIYGRMVQAGEWRDYAIDMLPDRVVFAIFRRASEMPIYRIEKQPKLANRQGQYAVLGAAGQVLKRGRELPQVLRVLERKLLKLVDEG